MVLESDARVVFDEDNVTGGAPETAGAADLGGFVTTATLDNGTNVV